MKRAYHRACCLDFFCRPSAFTLFGALCGLGCDSSSDEALQPVTIELMTGADSAAWDEAPVPDHVTISKRESLREPSDSDQVVVDDSWPISTFSLGAMSTNSSISLYASLSSGGDDVMACQSPPFSVAEFSGGTVSVMCGRTGRFSASQLEVTQVESAELVTTIANRFVEVSDRDSKQGVLYDLATYSKLDSALTLPIAPTSQVYIGGGVLLLVDDASIWVVDVETNDWGEVDQTALGVTAKDLSNGSAFYGDDGSWYLVGGTRDSSFETTSAVLVGDIDGNTRVVKTKRARVGASATWHNDFGLVIAGGHQDGSIERLGDPSGEFAVQSVEIPAFSNAALAPISTDRFVMVGGVRKDNKTNAVSFRLGCSDCEYEELSTVTLDVPKAYAMKVADDRALVASKNGAALVSAIRFNEEKSEWSVQDVALRQPRNGGVLLDIGAQMFLFAGGVNDKGKAVALEVYYP